MVNYEKGDTIRFRITTKDFDGATITPTSGPTCKIFKATGEELLTTLTVTSYGTGQYEGFYEIPSTITRYGDSTVLYAEWAWTYTSKNFIERTSFSVITVS